jgi:Type VII secretion system ESX-1, transport TM domain B
MSPDQKPLVKGVKFVSVLQVSAHFFIRTRMADTLQRRRANIIFNPMHWRRTFLSIGLVIGFLVLPVMALAYGWLKPAGTIGDTTKIVADRRTATIYAKLGGRLYPAYNLVSAQLIAGTHDNPTFVSSAEIAKWPQGEPVGIIGAMPETGSPATPQISQWTVCDTQTRPGAAPTVTGIDGDITATPKIGDEDMLLVSSGGGDYLVAGGYRVRVDRKDPSLKTAGVPESSAAVPMSRALLDTIPLRKNPPHHVHLLDQGPLPVICSTWRWDAADRKATITVHALRGLPLTLSQRAHLVTLVGSDNSGVRADQVVVNSGAATFVATTAVPTDPAQRETLYLVAANGVRFGVPFGDSVTALGLARHQARPVPHAWLQVWPAGPELSRAAALTQHSPTDVTVLPEKTNNNN